SPLIQGGAAVAAVIALTVYSKTIIEAVRLVLNRSLSKREGYDLGNLCSNYQMDEGENPSLEETSDSLSGHTE
ncbi:hypothetical protein, partial [Moorena sp. SIO3I8]|uniref:hypothetical protein n=1 Tax=Moorena sp. SIO3I8 TaxID=2607833 RepID=UPI0013C280B5